MNGKIKNVIVFVSGGCVTSVCDQDGNEIECHQVVDYDNEESGQYPVCGQELDDFILPEHPTCLACGYDPEKDNGKDCALKIANSK